MAKPARATACAGHAGRSRRERTIDDDERAVSPPRPEHRVDLQPERPRPAQSGRAPEALERNERFGAVERKVDRVRDAERRQRGGRGAVRGALRETVERVRGAVAGLRTASSEAIEERWPAGSDDRRRARAG